MIASALKLFTFGSKMKSGDRTAPDVEEPHRVDGTQLGPNRSEQTNFGPAKAAEAGLPPPTNRRQQRQRKARSSAAL